MRKPDTDQRDKDMGKADAVFIGRRQVFRLVGSVCAIGGLAAVVSCDSRQDMAHDGASTPAAPRNLSSADFALLSRLTELIIPKTETAGALEVGVPEFIDAALTSISGVQGYADPRFAEMFGSAEAFWNNLPMLFADGLRWVDEQARVSNGKRYLELNQTQQFAQLESAYDDVDAGRLEGRRAQFLIALKNLTAEGYYTSQEGLLKELGYRGNMPHDISQEGCKP